LNAITVRRAAPTVGKKRDLFITEWPPKRNPPPVSREDDEDWATDGEDEEL